MALGPTRMLFVNSEVFFLDILCVKQDVVIINSDN